MILFSNLLVLRHRKLVAFYKLTMVLILACQHCAGSSYREAESLFPQEQFNQHGMLRGYKLIHPSTPV